MYHFVSCFPILIILSSFIITTNAINGKTETPLTSTIKNESETEFIETEVLLGLRFWQLCGIGLCGILFIAVCVCTCCDCRIPRTKAEIDDRAKRRLESLEYSEMVLEGKVPLVKVDDNNK